MNHEAQAIRHQIEHEYADAIVALPRAWRSLKKVRDADWKLVRACIDVLGAFGRAAAAGTPGARDAFREELRLLGVADARSDVTELGTHGDSYIVDYRGRRVRVVSHLKRGNSSDPRRCLRIYWFWDDEARRVVIASLPAHAPHRLG